ncbi:hypothetical protein GQ600_2578 [Phytophthora cactorum]|nr:hypothetical protein GQ600_2578 [Phytophthora cactorum]
MSSSYSNNTIVLAETLKPLLPLEDSLRFRVSPYATDMGVQVDSYNCGMYVLLAFEEFVGKEPLTYISAKELPFFSYRYLCRCI